VSQLPGLKWMGNVWRAYRWLGSSVVTLGAASLACSAPRPVRQPSSDSEPEPTAAKVSSVSPGCDSGVRAGFKDAAKFPNIAACAGSWNEPGLVTRTNTGQATASALCADGWHVCSTIAEVQRKSHGLGCVAAEPEGTGFFAIAEGATKAPECFTSGPVGVLGCGVLGAPAPEACAPMERVSNPGCSALDEPWACERGSELWSLTKSSRDAGGVLCCAGAAPKLELPDEPWAFASGAPFAGSGPSECGTLTLTTTNTEPWGDEAFRNVPGDAPAVVVVTFARPVSAFHVSIALSGAKAYVTGFNVAPSRVSGRASFDGKEVRVPKGVTESSVVLSWTGVSADALSWVVGGKDRGTVASNGYSVECE
jgi:hypothetical protein